MVYVSVDGAYLIHGRADVIAQLEYVWTTMNNVTIPVVKVSPEIHGLVVHLVGIGKIQIQF